MAKGYTVSIMSGGGDIANYSVVGFGYDDAARRGLAIAHELVQAKPRVIGIVPDSLDDHTAGGTLQWNLQEIANQLGRLYEVSKKSQVSSAIDAQAKMWKRVSSYLKAAQQGIAQEMTAHGLE